MARYRNKKRKNKNDRRFFVVCMMIFILCIAGIIIYFLYDGEYPIKKSNEKKITIVDEDSNKRPIAVMIDNNVGYNSHAGLQDSYINYEAIVEGGLTRIMAIYKDKDVDLIGPVRSSRHYFLDYALESDAIYSHYGWSDYAKNDIKVLGVDNINGLTAEPTYWRDNNVSAPHNVFTNIDTLYKYAKESNNYDIETNNWKLLNYSANEINFKGPKENKETGDREEDPRIVANNISIKYSNFHTTGYNYDLENKYYLRTMDNKSHIDKTTGSQLHYKNIIIEKVKNSSLDSYGRQDLDTTGDGEGYYITNGYALPITWEKDDRNSKTIYKYLDGSKVKVNDGNTFIQIIPITTEPEFS